MSFVGKRELLAQIGPRYREARRARRAGILDEFVAATGYARKYAIRLLAGPTPAPGPIRRPRPRRYGRAVQEALAVAWAAANFICAKRLVPFLPELVASLERHGHLALAGEVRAQLLAMSAATADRILADVRRSGRPRGVGTTRRGALLKHQVPVRTFADWSDVAPGFVEGDLVAHCGTSARGVYLHSLVLTDVATGWTECLPLRHRGQLEVARSLEVARRILPFPLLGIDTDNGAEFLNADMLAYCERERITFTRGRAYRSNDQCFVEQKNGTIVRQIVGYDRYEGELAYRQLAELYRAVRLYVNFFQPSMKLRAKTREGSKARRTYDDARTPFQRLLASGILELGARQRLGRVCAALDPVRLLGQIHRLQDSLWRHAVTCPTGGADARPPGAGAPEVRFDAGGGVAGDDHFGRHVPTTPMAAVPDIVDAGRRRFHRAHKTMAPRTYRTRQDPLAAVADDLHRRFLAAPDTTAAALLDDLQRRCPGRYPDGLLRTLQRRVRAWRARVVLTFDDRLVADDPLTSPQLPAPLRAVQAS